MDIIAAHRHGLMEQLEEEIAALAGRSGDYGQRAVVLHHLFDHSRGSFNWALGEARRELRIATGLERLRTRLKRWGWLVPRRNQAAEALARLSAAIGDASRMRCAAAYRAYRLSAVPALREQAESRLPCTLLSLFEQCHSARRSCTAMADDVQQLLNAECQDLASAASDHDKLESAWAAIAATGIGAAARRLFSDKALEKAAARDAKLGRASIEKLLRNDERLPASFRANPAQHFYGLQQMISDRRRQQWREDCDRVPNAFELAA